MKRLLFSCLLGWLAVGLPSAEMPSMVYVDGGQYTSTSWEQSGQRISRVTVNAFQISAYEVTLDEWRAFVDDTGMEFDWSRRLRNTIAGGGAPEQRSGSTAMYHITWIEAVRYCNWLSRKLGYQEVYAIDELDDEIEVIWHADRIGFRLPTEAEWEYAARGGQRATATTYAGSDNIDEVAWYGDNSSFRVREVGRKKPNELGIYDMTGNVWEWCWDYYDVDYTPHNTVDPVGPFRANAPGLFDNPDWEGGARVVRGCGFFAFTDWCDITFRSGEWYRSLSTVGMRVVLSAVDGNSLNSSDDNCTVPSTANP